MAYSVAPRLLIPPKPAMFREYSQPYNAAVKSSEERVSTLLQALGIAPESFDNFLEWALAEHLVVSLAQSDEIGPEFFDRPTALKDFRDLLARRTNRQWSIPDYSLLWTDQGR